MIKLIFTKNREIFVIEIENRIIFYKDRRISERFQLMPKSEDYMIKIIMSRNKIPSWIAGLIEDANSGNNLQEYQNAKTEEELVPIIIKDACSKGCKFERRE